jgi:hypothetical protein
MLTTQASSPGLLFFSFLYRMDLFTEDQLKEKFETQWGDAIYFKPSHNPLIPYYSKEMGHNLERIFLVSTDLYAREYLLSSKLLALNWEREWSIDGKRMVNIDTGLLSAENLILATTKNFAHRVFIGQNIFADLTYQFKETTAQLFPWTYPDYQDPEKMEFFSWCRSFLLMQGKK